MKIQGSAIVDLSNPVLTNLRGTERRCSQCKKPFEPGDKIIVFVESEAVFPEAGDFQLALPDTNTFIVHVKGPVEGSCLEDFVADIIARSAPIAEPVVKEEPKDETTANTGGQANVTTELPLQPAT